MAYIAERLYLVSVIRSSEVIDADPQSGISSQLKTREKKYQFLSSQPIRLKIIGIIMQNGLVRAKFSSR